MVTKNYKARRSLVVSVKGVDYTINLLATSVYYKKNGEDSAGITDPNSKTVDICDKEYTLDTIIHELFHCFYNECVTLSANLQNDQIEEVFCEVGALNYFDIGKLAQKIMYEFLRDLGVDKK